MDRRFLIWTSAVAAAAMLLGLFLVDRPLAEWVRASGIEQARFFAWGLAALDTITGLGLWFWLLGCVALGGGAVALVSGRAPRLGAALATAALVQLATIGTMILGKDHFGRARPQFVLESGDWAHVWFSGGNSFPSGHSAFYFGLFLPLAAACPNRWLRATLLAIPVYVVLARIDLARHFLADVAASALIASLYALIAATLVRRRLPAQPPPSSLAPES